jgi:hypothetical protein
MTVFSLLPMSATTPGHVALRGAMDTPMEEPMEPAPAYGNGRPRLVIQRLELENFKSYAGVQHIGPFHKVSAARLVVSRWRALRGTAAANVLSPRLAEFLRDRGSQWERKVQCHRRDALRLWQARQAGALARLRSCLSPGPSHRAVVP